jgi:hypothetical protein
MKNIFVFCFFHPQAQKNYANSILRPVPSRIVTECFAAEGQSTISQAMGSPDGFYAWGFKPGKRLVNTLWRIIDSGDLALGFASRHYRVVAQVLAKVESETLSKAIWPGEPESTDRWPLIVLLSKPHLIAVPASAALPYLPSEYRGAMRMNEGRITNIVSDFGSLDAFVRQRLCPGFQADGCTSASH